MGSFSTKEDDLARISISVFITNFPLSTSAKELFHACKQYGHVVDSFIPTKKSKNGKRFGFVRFINVFNEERLVNNLCTVWIDRHKLHANIARFQRSQVKKDGDGGKQNNFHSSPKEILKTNVPKGEGKSYMGVLKGDKHIEVQVSKSEPALVLGDECMVTKEISNALFGRVKEFASLANLKLAMTNEGFVDLTIKYMGELWVMLEFKSEESKSKFNDNISVASWFSQIIEASLDFTVEGRIAWVEVEGIPFKLWSGNTFSRIANKWGKLLDVDDQEDSCFHSKRLCIHTKSGTSIKEEFKVIHRGKAYWIRANETPGWVPEFTDDLDDEDDQDDIKSNDDISDIHKMDNTGENSVGEEIPETIFAEDGTVKSRAEGDFKDKNVDMSEDPFNIYSLLNKNKCTNGNVNNSGSSLKYPPGFTPSVGIDEKDVSVVDGTTRNDGTTRVKNKEEYTDAFSDCRDKCNSNENGAESI
ncbi:nucleotide-binding alpha-beta plait domain-containing protein [Tanacetum coccineum]|uniref:Nucleotide-binding alpha-beta plait domain-containing protein n=1 Tax=Tanacetum coccineum TaxID=301880 RepID=A0ABQ5AKG9_9ASTR